MGILLFTAYLASLRQVLLLIQEPAVSAVLAAALRTCASSSPGLELHVRLELKLRVPVLTEQTHRAITLFTVSTLHCDFNDTSAVLMSGEPNMIFIGCIWKSGDNSQESVLSCCLMKSRSLMGCQSCVSTC